MAHGRPRTTLHFAQSLDGRIALGPGEPRILLSTPEGIVAAHRARAAHDAVLVGIGTVLCDDPRLTVRACTGTQPRRVVLDSGLRLPLDSRLVRSLANARAAGVVVVGAEGRASSEARAKLVERGVEVLIVAPSPEGRVALAPALAALKERCGIERLMVEGGAAVLTSFARGRHVDAVTVEIAARLLGAPGLVALADIGRALPLREVRIDRAGANLLLHAEVADGAAS